jgi:hypothetical protein
MNRRDDGNVVFFCGAGISVGTGLPDFRGLVTEVYARTGQAPTLLERDLLKRGQLDKVLGLLEERLNPGRLRREVIECLSEPPSGALNIHDALLALSRNAQDKIRLVTTNFDDRFQRAGDQQMPIDAAPKLPMPKPHDWTSVVHLHGRIQPDDSENHLVLTAADFGRAYLTERWAARFITELFREFTVVFVGYSLTDPVLSYMVDALAAERSRGARFQKAYAFADHHGGDKGRERAEIAWKGKNVEPILFHSYNRFSRLNRTLIEWARLCRDPLSSRREIVLRGVRRLPGGPADPLAERVCWALSDATTADILAHSPPTGQENSYTTIAAWLDIFDEKGLLARGSLVSGNSRSHQVPIVTNKFSLPQDSQLEGVTARLAYWLAQHAHVPQVFGWVVRKGGGLHRVFRSMLLRRLAERTDVGKPAPNMPERLRLLWTIVLNDQPSDPELLLWSDRLIRNATSDLERRTVEHAVVDTLRPRLAVRPGPSSSLRFRLFNNPGTALTPLEECAHLVLTLGDSDIQQRSSKALERSDFLRRHAFKLTDHLHLAMELLAHDEDGIRRADFYRPAIEDHEQNRYRRDWTVLIDWVRDSYFALAELHDGQAEHLLQRWLQLRKSLFNRLVLHALTEDEMADIAIARDILLSGEPLGLWDGELHHEVLVFLRKAGHRTPEPFLSELIASIKAGPAPEA